MKTTLRELLQDLDFRGSVPIEIREFRTGDVIIEEGSRDTKVYLVLKGKAEVYAAVDQVDSSGCRAGIARIAENQILGELAMFDHEPRTASVIAASDCEVAAMDNRALISYMDRNPAQGYWILKEILSQIVQRMRQTTLRSNTITALYLHDHAE